MTINFNFCADFKISKLVCVTCNNNSESNNNKKIQFNLIESNGKQYKFEKLLPDTDDYLFLKINSCGKIISMVGNYEKKLKMKVSNFYLKNIDDIRTHKKFFLEYIKPLFQMSIEKGEAYQFLFNTNKDKTALVCSIYPCCIPNYTSSVDIVIREPVEIIKKESTNQFLLKTSKGGCKIEPLEEVK
jgi:hypothetical protein